MIKIFDIRPYAIATPDAHLRCGASPNVAHHTIVKTLLDKLLCSKMLEPKSVATISPRTREPTVPGGCFTLFLKIGVDAEIGMGGVTLLGQVAVTAEAAFALTGVIFSIWEPPLRSAMHRC